MMEILSRDLPRRSFLALLLATFLFTLTRISSIVHVDKEEQNGHLRERALSNNTTVAPKVLIDWDTYVRNGAALSCAMQATEDGARQYIRPDVPVNSPWVDYGDLNTWGWEPQTQPGVLYEVNRVLSRAFGALNIDPAQNVYIEIKQNTPVNVDGEEYQSTGAMYGSAYNLQDGAIISHSAHSPESEAPNLSRYPKCRRWSDVTFLQWQHMAQGNVQNLNHVFRETITNQDTRSIMRRVLGKPDSWNDWDELHSASRWRSFYPQSDEFNALLYTPNVRGVAWLLIQHKQQLGRRIITQITTFGADFQPALYLKIDAVPEG
ncbi:hypothetical protein DTO217A2_3617 [Paecilomyces variotii]|nr:hypothetical protein DTO217A2_3617 [Paecilomyces variotii]KAJ9379369.1 hypothetical protein DTO063F5_7252 [Paecilomyces variotii]